MSEFEQELGRRLSALRERNLHRELRQVDSAQGPIIHSGGRELVNFSSNDYLGLANDPALKEAASRAIEQFGVGSGASRLICGSLAPHQELEAAIARFKKTPAALSFSSGYATALGTLGALADKETVIILDKLAHACLIDGARLAGAKIRVFPHNDLDRLEHLLKWAARVQRPGLRAAGPSHRPSVLVVTESIFSMDGDRAPLTEVVALKEKYGAWLMLDEAHATGLCGSNGRGLAEAAGVADRVEIQMGTLGKALGAAGGYIAGSRVLIDLLVNRARSFIFSTAPTPASAAAACAGIRFVQSARGDQRRRQLWERVKQAARLMGHHSPPASAILPLVIGNEAQAMEAAGWLREAGILVPAIRYPSVARGAARLRVTVTAGHTSAHIAALGAAMASVGEAWSAKRNAYTVGRKP